MKLNRFLFAGLAAMSLAACSDSDDSVVDNDDMSAKEQGLSLAVNDYVDNTVLPTYSDMADAAIRLYDRCETIREHFDAGTLTEADIKAAGDEWKKSRKAWELSEAFLFGPATNHNIDPHIDSWPLDKAAMDDLLERIRQGKSWSIDNNGGYGLLGFHSIEYMLFELSEDENNSKNHSTSYTSEELDYLLAVAEDLRNQTVCLEACWAGTDNLSAAKQTILAEAELDYGENYGEEMKNARKAGSRFKTFQAAAEEIVSGCINIADEVGNTKIGRPHLGSSDEDKNYIESPYSLNSIEDFVDNIISIRNSYMGVNDNNVSLSAYVKAKNPALDTKVREAINNAISAISTIPEPFTKTASGVEAENAVKVVGTELVSVLEELHQELLK